MSNGTIVNHIKKLSFNLEEILNKVKDKILNSRKMYTDATTSRCNNRNISVRNYSTDEHTLLCATNTKFIFFIFIKCNINVKFIFKGFFKRIKKYHFRINKCSI